MKKELVTLRSLVRTRERNNASVFGLAGNELTRKLKQNVLVDIDSGDCYCKQKKGVKL